jgi:hypothetical protein
VWPPLLGPEEQGFRVAAQFDSECLTSLAFLVVFDVGHTELKEASEDQVTFRRR